MKVIFVLVIVDGMCFSIQSDELPKKLIVLLKIRHNTCAHDVVKVIFNQFALFQAQVLLEYF